MLCSCHTTIVLCSKTGFWVFIYKNCNLYEYLLTRCFVKNDATGSLQSMIIVSIRKIAPVTEWLYMSKVCYSTGLFLKRLFQVF